MAETLVSLEYEWGTAGVVRDGAGLWLTDRLDRGAASQIDGDRIVPIGLAGIGSLFGGRLPQGATRAIVVDAHELAVANGAWIALLRDHDAFGDPPVRFENDVGEIVRRGPRGEPVTDAAEACPACAACEWESVPDGVICGRCGHLESGGVWYASLAGRETVSEAELTAAERAVRARMDVQLRSALDAGLPVYAIERHPQAPTFAGMGSDGEGPHSLTVVHGGTARVEVEHRRRAYEPPRDVARRGLARALGSPAEWPQLSPHAVALWIHARRREGEAAAARAEAFETDVVVDGTPVTFTGRRTADAWALSADVDEVRVTVSARELALEGLRLRRLADPLAELGVTS